MNAFSAYTSGTKCNCVCNERAQKQFLVISPSIRRQFIRLYFDCFHLLQLLCHLYACYSTFRLFGYFRNLSLVLSPNVRYHCAPHCATSLPYFFSFVNVYLCQLFFLELLLFFCNFLKIQSHYFFTFGSVFRK